MDFIKRLFFLVFTFLAFNLVEAQTDEEPAVWSHHVTHLSDTEYELEFKATISKDWFIYSLYTAEGGSMPSEFEFVEAGKDYELLGKTEEGKTYNKYTDVFDLEETFFKEKALFRQKIRLLNPQVAAIKAILYYQICKEVCVLKEKVFTFSLDGKTASVTKKSIDERSLALSNALKLNLKNASKIHERVVQQRLIKNDLLILFGFGFLGGLIALLTPCVFPLIPLTVSYFTKHSGNRSQGTKNALLYGFFILLIYFLLSLPFHIFDSVDSQILNTIATNVWLNLLFFVIFVFFAFSFFGYYELSLPSSWANRLDQASAKIGGGLGIFLMALTLAIVSFSCTGPILGGLLGSTTLAQGSVATNLSIGMTGFGLALALPFALFAVFPTWLHSLPKSGSWMTTVKVVLGFLELALAFKFLSNADLVGGWGILKREVFLVIWILIFVLLALYLFGVFRFPHDESKQKPSKMRLSLGILSGAFAIYLTLGLGNVISLKVLSGFPPPDFYTISPKKSDCPLGLDCYKDFEAGLAVAKKQNKPILLDFTGWGCVNCRRMEENVWSDPLIYPMLKNEYVLISLYVDDRTKLHESQQFNFQFDSGHIKTIKTVGQKWGTFQTINFNAISQPYYVLLSPNMEVLNSAIQYVDAKTYEEWLKSGLDQYQLTME